MGLCAAVVFDLADPAINMAEAQRISDTVSQDDCITTLVKTFGDSPKPLLASSIPNIEYSPKLLCFKFFDLEIDSYSTHILLLKLVLGISHHNGCFANPAVPNYQVFVLYLRLLY